MCHPSRLPDLPLYACACTTGDILDFNVASPYGMLGSVRDQLHVGSRGSWSREKEGDAPTCQFAPSRTTHIHPMLKHVLPRPASNRLQLAHEEVTQHMHRVHDRLIVREKHTNIRDSALLAQRVSIPYELTKITARLYQASTRYALARHQAVDRAV